MSTFIENLSQSERVVVTGIGVISSIGIGKNSFWNGLLAGDCGIKHMQDLEKYNMDITIGGKVNDFNPAVYIDSELIDSFGRTSQLGIAASKLALKDSELQPNDITDLNSAILIGTTMGECNVQESMVTSWNNCDSMDFDLQDIYRVPDNMLAINIAYALGLNVDCLVIPTACAAGNYAISHGFDLIRTGEVDLVIAGGCDAFSNIAFMGFGRMLALAKEKCQPFDKNRSGIAIGEGSGIIILESLAHAEKRKATIYSEMIGYGLSCDANHMTIPHKDGIKSVMKRALNNSNISTNDIDLICAHGTGTQMNDKTESSVIIDIFGKKGKTIPVNSIKSMLGHTMGAASALEAISCILSIYSNKIAPTINYETPDEECPINCVPNKMIEKKVDIALNNSFAFGGNNASTIFSSFSH